MLDPSYGVINVALGHRRDPPRAATGCRSPDLALWSLVRGQRLEVDRILPGHLHSRTSRPSTRGYYEAAAIDGAGAWARFWRDHAARSCSAAIVLSVILAIVNFLKAFALVFVMTQGGPAGRTELMATYVYREAFGTGQLRFGFSAAASIVLFAMIMAVHGAGQPRRPGRRGGAVTRRRGSGGRDVAVACASSTRSWGWLPSRWRSRSTGWSSRRSARRREAYSVALSLWPARVSLATSTRSSSPIPSSRSCASSPNSLVVATGSTVANVATAAPGRLRARAPRGSGRPARLLRGDRWPR